jgi:hypothetical protein
MLTRDAVCGAGDEAYAQGVTLGDFAVSYRCAARPEDLRVCASVTVVGDPPPAGVTVTVEPSTAVT